MKVLTILNDPPYGTERSYNGLRLAGSLAKRKETDVKVFLIGDAAACARKGQNVPHCYYNIELMSKAVVRQGGEIGVCGSCMEARGITKDDLLEGARPSTLDELTAWSLWADKVIVF